VNAECRVFVAGGQTLLGAAIVRRLEATGFTNLLGVGAGEPCLVDAAAVDRFFAEEQPSHVFMAGGLSGGIFANQRRPADLMRDNLLAATHVISAAYRHGATKLLYLASSCSYPRLCPQPMQETDLGSGPLEPTSEAYATAKLAGSTLCRAYAAQYGAAFVSAIPANAFGPGDDFRPEEGHVIPALISKCHLAKMRDDAEVVVWGTGTPRREFVFADDLADACLFAMEHYHESMPINLGGGEDCSVAELAMQIAEVVGYRGRIAFDSSRPDGMPLKRLDGSRIRHLGWRPATPFRTALTQTYRWFVEHPATKEYADAR
jgi:GDP-L-fucose synthase